MVKWSDNLEDVLSRIKNDLNKNIRNKDNSFIHKGKKVIVEYRTIESVEKEEKPKKITSKKTKFPKPLSKSKRKKQIMVKLGSSLKLNYDVFSNKNTNETYNSVEKIDYTDTEKHITEFNEEFEQYNKAEKKSDSFGEGIPNKYNNSEVVFRGLDNRIFQNSKIFDEEIYLCIGLDIGSSTTKVVIKEAFPTIGSEDVFYLVDFASHGIYGQEYLLPTHISFDGNGYFIPKYGEIPTFTNLKVNYMNGNKKYRELLELYVAFVIKYSIAWFIEKHGNYDIIKNKNIIWSVNLGIPSAQFNSLGENKKYLELLENACKQTKEHIEFESFNIVPEIVASIQSFIKRNDIAHEGLYCVSDVGAGTLDICTFRVSENEGNVVYSFYKSAVKKLGVYELQKCCKNLKPLKAVYNYRNNVLTAYRRVIHQTYVRRDPYAREWKEKLPIASSGGGSSLSFYKSIINEDLTKWIKKYCIDLEKKHDCQGFRELDIKYNSSNIITSIKNIDCSRLNVALGLSYNISTYDDIKKYYKECEIEDIEHHKTKNIEENFISKDMV